MTVNKFSKILKKPVLIITLILAALIFLGGLRIMFYAKSPDVLLLVDRAEAHWIRYDSEMVLEAKPSCITQSEFRYVFNVDHEVDAAVIYLQALKKASVLFDGVHIFSSPDDFSQWKNIQRVKIPFPVQTGSHEIRIRVTSENSYPAVIAYSATLPMKTGKGWYASNDGKNWRIAAPASRIEQPAMSKKYPSSLEALFAVWPYLAIVFLVVFFISLFAGDDKNAAKQYINWKLRPSHVRWIMLFLWMALSLNNMFKLNFQAGSDIWGHIEYIDYIAAQWTLPLAYDGWQMFQAPLNYVLSAPLYAALITRFDLSAVVKIMSIIPVLCGLLQIEIVYRAGKLVFAERKDLQIITVLAGSLIPVHIYVCQYVGNEPLAACLISLVILLCLSLVMSDQTERPYQYFMLLGMVWGLALLSKMTAFLLAPVLIFVIAFHAKSVKKPLKYFLRSIMIVFVVPVMIAGWYYLRNYIKLGNAFIGLFDPLQMMQWWQDPSYRTLSHLFSFGQALTRPVYAGVTSFWDMFYSTLWLDGINSGLADVILWNTNFMIAGALLALLPCFFIITGIVSALLNKDIKYRNVVIFSVGLLSLFLSALIDMYIVCPVYSRTKASYTLGLLPCWAILIAAGAEPFLRKRIIRSVALALLACWAFAAYAAYFVVGFQ